MTEVKDILEDLTLEEILEHCNMTTEEALTILINEGHLELPPFLEHLRVNEEEDKEEDDIDE